MSKIQKINTIYVEVGAHAGAKMEFLHTVYDPFYGAPSVYALVSRMAARIAYLLIHIDKVVRL